MEPRGGDAAMRGPRGSSIDTVALVSLAAVEAYAAEVRSRAFPAEDQVHR